MTTIASWMSAGPHTLTRPEPSGYEHLELRPVSPTIGAELHGLDLRRELTDAEHAEVHRSLLDWKVVFFRDQRITGEQHRAFAARWGELEVHPFLPSGDVPEVVRFAKDADTKGYENIWHSDVTWRDIPALGSVLRALDVPPFGGDTLWADMAAAYDGLPEELQARIDGMVAVHDFTQSFGQAMGPDELAKMQEQYPAVEHPVVRSHPETGRKTLYVNAIFTSHILGLDRDESDELLDVLTRQAHVPEYQCRFRWASDSIAFWDNRATQHYAVSDYWPQVRVMERATIIGDRPF